MLVFADGSIVGTVGGGEWERRVIEAALGALDKRAPVHVRAHLTRDMGMCCGGAMEAYVEPLEQTERLHVFGAGHVGTALARLARDLAFEVHVYDERDEWLAPERLPGCTLHEGVPTRKLPELGALDYAVIVTHSHQLDQALLMGLIEAPFGYLGMIGSRAKVAKFFVRLRAAGLDEGLFGRVSTPVGLDIGAETPEEIAVSIAAELIRVRRRHRGPVQAMAEKPLPARGGDGTATPPALTEG